MCSSCDVGGRAGATMDEPSRIADAFPRYVPAKTPEPTASDIAAAQLVREQHAPHMVTYACLECGERWPCRPYRRAEQLLIGAGVDLESSGGNSPLLACGRSLAGTGEEQRVSKIDETILAIQAAMTQLNETQLPSAPPEEWLTMCSP